MSYIFNSIFFYYYIVYLQKKIKKIKIKKKNIYKSYITLKNHIRIKHIYIYIWKKVILNINVIYV